jgi:hypothetical protein
MVSAAWAIPPLLVNYQAQLIDNTSGAPVDDTVSITFRIYTSVSGGTLLWTETHPSVDVIDGIYNVILGASTPLDPGDFTIANRWLELAVNGEIFDPRLRLTSVFYALNSANADDADMIDGMDSSEFAADSHTHDGSDITNTVMNADMLDGKDSTEFASAVHGHDGSAITGTVPDADKLDNKDSTEFAAASHPHDGSAITGKVPDADLLDGLNSTAFSFTTHLHDARYVNEGQANSVSGAMIVNSTIAAADLADNSVNAAEIAANAVTESEIRWSLNHTAADLNGGLINLENTSNGTVGNIPAGVMGGANGSPSGQRVFGVLGLAPALGRPGSAAGDFPLNNKYGVGGAVNVGIGVAGISNNGIGLYGDGTTMGAKAVGQLGPTNGYLGAQGTTNFDGIETADWSGFEIGVAGISTGGSIADNFGLLGHSNNVGVRGEYSGNPTGKWGQIGTSTHAGYFYSNDGAGLNQSTLRTVMDNPAGGGIALWAMNNQTASTDAAVVVSHLGTGPLFKGFGSNGGEDEIRIDNDGQINLYNGDFIRTVRIDPSEGPTSAGSQITLYNGDGNTTIEIDGDFAGDGRITTQELQITGGSDLSEQFDILDPGRGAEPGMVVSIDPERPGKLMVSNAAYDKKVAGIISGAGGIKPGMLMGQKHTLADGAHPVALSGRVYCWVDASTASIQPGDLLTTSDTPGHAMKVTDHAGANGAILGKAMTSMEAGRGLVLVLVSLQ